MVRRHPRQTPLQVGDVATFAGATPTERRSDDDKTHGTLLALPPRSATSSGDGRPGPPVADAARLATWTADETPSGVRKARPAHYHASRDPVRRMQYGQDYGRRDTAVG
jgi:hypothetical protein